jgi:uncharacterized membrane-anchored protein
MKTCDREKRMLYWASLCLLLLFKGLLWNNNNKHKEAQYNIRFFLSQLFMPQQLTCDREKHMLYWASLCLLLLFKVLLWNLYRKAYSHSRISRCNKRRIGIDL